MYWEGEIFVLDFVLCDNNISDEYLLGIFYLYEKLWYIKKENIGLIEVMGWVILLVWLKVELEEVKKFWLNEDN